MTGHGRVERGVDPPGRPWHAPVEPSPGWSTAAHGYTRADGARAYPVSRKGTSVVGWRATSPRGMPDSHVEAASPAEAMALADTTWPPAVDIASAEREVIHLARRARTLSRSGSPDARIVAHLWAAVDQLEVALAATRAPGEGK